MNETSFPRWLKWSLLGALAVLVLGYGAIFLYAKVINDGPDEFDQDDLAAALDEPANDASADDTDDPSGDGSTAIGTDEPEAEPGPATEEPATEDRTSWRIVEGSEVGYRVKEILFGVDTEGVGRTGEVVGGIEISGSSVVSGEFIVDVASISSDDGRRDSQFRGRIMSTDEFPEASFALTTPIELGADPSDGLSVTATATGELTLRGVTNQVTFEVTAQQENGRIGVLGSIRVVFADYAIANPSFGGITTEDEGLLEFVLVLDRA